MSAVKKPVVQPARGPITKAPAKTARPAARRSPGSLRIQGSLLTAVVLTIFVVWFGSITVTELLQKSLTVDETIHLLSGYAPLRWGDFRANPEHPPLAKILAALPLLLQDVKDPRPPVREWDPDVVANRMAFVANDADQLFFYPKLMMIGIALLLGVVIYRWSRELFGIEAAIAALTLYALDPNILAHSQIVHTDLPMTAVAFIGTYFFWRVSNRVTLTNFTLAILSFGAAATTKYSYPILFLSWAILASIRIVCAAPVQLCLGQPATISTRRQKLFLFTAIFFCGLVTSYLCIWAAYGFHFRAIHESGLSLPVTKLLNENPLLQRIATFATDYHLAPEAWIYGQRYAYSHLLRHTYMLGEISDQGFWLYFPLAFAVKTPLPTLLLLLIAVGFWIGRKNERLLLAFLLVPPLIFFSLAVWSRINIGVRHILPVYPFLFVLVGAAVGTLWRSSQRWIRAGLLALAIWLVVSVLLTYPDHLAYFNELAGGANNGRKVLLDSNLDWGQDLKGLKRWMDVHGVDKIQFLYFGIFDIVAPRYYKINALYLPGSWVNQYLSPGQDSGIAAKYMAVSANHLPGPYRSDRDEKFNQRQSRYVTPLRALRPLDSVGHSILIYDVNEVIQEYRKAIETGAASVEARFFLAHVLNYSGRVDEALEHFRRVVELDPSFALAHYDLALCLTRRGDLDGALKHFRAAADLGLPRNTYQFTLGNLFAQQGRFDDAIEQYRRELELRPDFSPAYLNLGKVMAAKGQLGTAADYFRKAIERDPESAEGHEALARALAEQGKREEAAEHFKKAVAILRSRATKEQMNLKD